MALDTSKIIKGVVGGGRYTVTAPIVKEDYGLYLKIEGLELPEIYQVDFSNSDNNGTSMTMIGNADGVLIPSQFISTGKDVFAFLYHVGEDFGRTVYKFRIPNKVRPDRTNEEPTPEEQSTIDQAISALSSAVSATAQDVIDADASAQSASQSAENAHDSAVDAQNYAESASGYASDAQGYAEQASASATASAQSAENAHDSAVDAQNYAESASGYASDAQGYAEQASASATASAQSAQSASQSAQTASEKADSIIGLTAQAQTLPSGSSASASYDAQTGVLNLGIPKGKDGTNGTDGTSPTANVSKTGKTATITITDQNGTTSAQVEDGTDGTDGKDGKDGVDGISPTVTITPITGGHRITITDADGEHSADVMDGDDYTLTEQDKQDIADIAEADLTPTILSAFPTDIASGAVASFTDGADNLPLKSLVVNINPVQDLHGQESPYPAGGGKNKLPLILADIKAINTQGTWSGNVYTLNGVTFTANLNSAGEIVGVDVNGTASAITSLTLLSNAANTFANMILNGSPSGSTATTAAIAVQYWNGGSFAGSAFEIGNGLTLTQSDNIYLLVRVNSGATIKNAHFYPMIRLSSVTGATFAPYSNVCPISGWTVANVYHSGADTSDATTYSITFPSEAGTVYGGTLDVTTGVLTVNKVALTFNGSENWASVTANGHTRQRVNSVLIGIKQITGGGQTPNLISDIYPTKTPNATYAGIVGITNQQSSADLYIMDNRYDYVNSASDYKTWLSTNNMKVVYELAEPVTYQLTPTEVATLLGDNTIWADTGDTEVEYRADPDLYIQRKMPEVNVEDVQINGQSIVSDGVANISMPQTVTVTGTTPTITAQADTRYVCGEVSTLDITVPATGIIDVIFTSGATATVLTVTPPTGMAMKWANGFDPTALEANTTYEINVMDGCLGVVGTWT